MSESITCQDCRRDPCRCADYKRGFRVSPSGTREAFFKTPRPDPEGVKRLQQQAKFAARSPCRHETLICACCGMEFVQAMEGGHADQNDT